MVNREQSRESGFTLLESIISFTILVTVIVAVTQLFTFDLTSINIAKTRALGLAIATQQMEYLRDLPYNSLSTQFGAIYPPGNIADDSYQVVDNIKFHVHTVIEYYDDPYDGNAAGTIPGKPKDLYPYDYKLVQIYVYINSSGTKVASLTTSIAAKAAETASNTGILSIKVNDANGNPVNDATVTITNPNPTPAVNITTTTDETGSVVIPVLPPDSNHGYHVVVSKAGYSSSWTSPYTSGSQVPTIPDLNVLAQQITSQTFAIDLVSSLTVHVVDTGGNPENDQSVTITGAKTLYTNPTVYKYQTTKTTDNSGNISLTNMEWESYSFSVPNGKYIVSTVPYQPSALSPNTSLTVTLTITGSSSYPTITSVSPTSDATGTSSVSLTITGTNLKNATFYLSQAGQANIVATGLSSSSTSLSGNLSLTGAATGNWDIVVTNGGNTVTQTGGYVVTP